MTMRVIYNLLDQSPAVHWSLPCFTLLVRQTQPDHRGGITRYNTSWWSWSIIILCIEASGFCFQNAFLIHWFQNHWECGSVDRYSFKLNDLRNRKGGGSGCLDWLADMRSLLLWQWYQRILETPQFAVSATRLSSVFASLDTCLVENPHLVFSFTPG